MIESKKTDKRRRRAADNTHTHARARARAYMLWLWLAPPLPARASTKEEEEEVRLWSIPPGIRFIKKSRPSITHTIEKEEAHITRLLYSSLLSVAHVYAYA